MRGKIEKLKPVGSVGLIAVLLGLVIVCAQMCSAVIGTDDEPTMEAQ